MASPGAGAATTLVASLFVEGSVTGMSDEQLLERFASQRDAAAEEANMLHEEIARLPDRYRTPVILCYLEGLTQDEAASQLGWPIGTVGVRLMRARERLRVRLTRRGFAPAMLPSCPSPRGASPWLRQSRYRRPGRPWSSPRRPARRFIRCHPRSPESPSRCSGVWRSRRPPVRSSRYLSAACSPAGSRTGIPVFLRNGPKPVQPSRQPKVGREPEEAKSILSNGGFEQGDAKGLIAEAWQKGAKMAGVEYQWDRTVAHEGTASLHLRKTVQRYFPIAQWSQEVKRSGATPRLKVSAFVKAKEMTKAILDVSFVDGERRMVPPLGRVHRPERRRRPAGHA